MDEAEHCDRMTLIYKGNIIAMGTPEEMKTKIMKDEILAICVPDAEEWLAELEAVKGVKEVAMFGAHLHVVVENAATAKPAIEKFFRDGGAKDYKVEKIMPSLEDVFVSSIENYDKTHESEKN